MRAFNMYFALLHFLRFFWWIFASKAQNSQKDHEEIQGSFTACNAAS
jgi:hypothetical protein